MLSRRRLLQLLGFSAFGPWLLKDSRVVANVGQGATLHYIHPEHIIGDVHPFFYEGVWYVFYLAPGFHSKLMRSRDLLHWEQVEITHRPPQSGDPDLAPYFVLGVFRDTEQGVFRTYHGWTAGNMYSHTSEDLLYWEFAPVAYRILAQYQRYTSQRDPYVFWNDEEGQYWCVMTCKVKGYDEATNGAVGYASSPDLQHWEGRGDLFFPATLREPEVPQVFHIGDKWYLLASIHTGVEVGKPSYWMSDSSTGPWFAGLPDSLDGSNLAAANVGFDGQRWLLMGWIPLTTTAVHARYTWGGHLALPREIIQFTDGSLGTRLELGIGASIRGERLFDSRVDAFRVVRGECALGAQITCRASDSETVLDLPVISDGIDASLQLIAAADCNYAGLRLAGFIDVGLDLTQGRLVATHAAYYGEPFAELQIVQVDFYNVRIIWEEDLIEIFVNDRYSLCARLPEILNAPTLEFVSIGRVVVDRIQLFQLNRG